MFSINESLFIAVSVAFFTHTRYHKMSFEKFYIGLYNHLLPGILNQLA